jgi:hypothetical protein
MHLYLRLSCKGELLECLVPMMVRYVLDFVEDGLVMRQRGHLGHSLITLYVIANAVWYASG